MIFGPGLCPRVQGTLQPEECPNADLRTFPCRSLRCPNAGPPKKKALRRRPFKSTACFGSPTWARTRDLRINSPSLYQLSYRGIFRCVSEILLEPKSKCIALDHKTRIIEHFALLKKTPTRVRVFTGYDAVTILCGSIRSCALAAIVTARLSVTTSPMMIMLGLAITCVATSATTVSSVQINTRWLGSVAS